MRLILETWRYSDTKPLHIGFTAYSIAFSMYCLMWCEISRPIPNPCSYNLRYIHVENRPFLRLLPRGSNFGIGWDTLCVFHFFYVTMVTIHLPDGSPYDPVGASVSVNGTEITGGKQIDGLVQERRNSNALAMDLRLFARRITTRIVSVMMVIAYCKLNWTIDSTNWFTC